MATVKEHLFSAVGDRREEIYNRFNVESLSVFGSVAKGSATPDSDVDFLVRYKKQLRKQILQEAERVA